MWSTFPFINTLSEGGFRMTKNTNLLKVSACDNSDFVEVFRQDSSYHRHFNNEMDLKFILAPMTKS